MRDRFLPFQNSQGPRGLDPDAFVRILKVLAQRSSHRGIYGDPGFDDNIRPFVRPGINQIGYFRESHHEPRLLGQVQVYDPVDALFPNVLFGIVE